MVIKLLKHGSKIGNATVVVDIIPPGNPEIRPGRKMTANYLTDHDTGNSGRGADADMHNRYIHNMAEYEPKDTSHVSWHLTVDEYFIFQHIPFDEIAWHCGDGTGPGNYSSVGIEKCMHQGADRNKIEANAIALHSYLMKELNIPIENVRPHQAWSGKYCPQLILNKYGSFRPFRDKIEAAYKSGDVKQVSNPVEVTKPTAVKPKPMITESIVDYLNSRKMDSSFSARSKLATQYGIHGYQGKAEQNTLLLDRIRSNWKPAAKPALKTESVVDYLNRQGKASSFPAREKLAAQYGIKGYRGSAAQNTLLLDRMRSGWKAPAPKKKKEYVHLPKSAPTWRTYRLNEAPRAENSDWSLTPSRYGGLEYEVLGHPQANVVTIKTSRGKRNIYVAPSTGARVYNR